MKFSTSLTKKALVFSMVLGSLGSAYAATPATTDSMPTNDTTTAIYQTSAKGDTLSQQPNDVSSPSDNASTPITPIIPDATPAPTGYDGNTQPVGNDDSNNTANTTATDNAADTTTTDNTADAPAVNTTATDDTATSDTPAVNTAATDASVADNNTTDANATTDATSDSEEAKASSEEK